MLLIDFLVYNEVHISNMRPMPAELKCIRYTMMADIGGESTEFLSFCTKPTNSFSKE